LNILFFPNFFVILPHTNQKYNHEAKTPLCGAAGMSDGISTDQTRDESEDVGLLPRQQDVGTGADTP
jgi:hypothetical protein